MSIKKLLFPLLLAGITFCQYSCKRGPNDPGLEYMPDMYRSPSYETYSPNPVFKNGMTAQVPPAGTIPRGYMPDIYPNTQAGYEAAGKELKDPLPASPAVVAKGKELFMIFCVHCHGPEGKGNGTIVKNGNFPPPPSFQGPLKDLPEGKMFQTITYGRNLMGSHASQLKPKQRWEIIRFLQTLQQLGKSNTTNQQ